jgi:uncharacterized protein
MEGVFMAHEICHVEILAQDLQASGGFYSGVFGWEVTPWGEGYVMFKAGDGVGGALIKTDEPYPSVMFYIHVADIEAKLKEIEAAGGKTITPKTLITPEMGYFAAFSDPAGNAIGLFSQS